MAQSSLVLLHEVIVAGGAVTTLTTGTIALVKDEVYAIDIGIINNTANSVTGYLNADTTVANYARSSLSTANTAESSANTLVILGDTTGQMNTAHGIIALNDSTPFVGTLGINERTTAATEKGAITGMYSTTETGITEFQITGSSTALQNGTYIRIWKQIQS